MQTDARPPPRLFAVMAKDAPVAVVIRRGPAAWTQLTLWHTDHDVFQPGAWFHGRIFAEKCDLSPDGHLFVYAAYKGSRWASNYTASWTAVSRPPWLHALALWPMGTTYGGGGRFAGNRRLILRGAGRAHPDHPAQGIELVAGEAPLHRSTCEIEGAEWTGRDQNNRLVYAARGCIYARSEAKKKKQKQKDVQLADLNDQTPHAEAPPRWAKRPLP